MAALLATCHLAWMKAQARLAHKKRAPGRGSSEMQGLQTLHLLSSKALPTAQGAWEEYFLCSSGRNFTRHPRAMQQTWALSSDIMDMSVVGVAIFVEAVRAEADGAAIATSLMEEAVISGD